MKNNSNTNHTFIYIAQRYGRYRQQLDPGSASTDLIARVRHNKFQFLSTSILCKVTNIGSHVSNIISTSGRIIKSAEIRPSRDGIFIRRNHGAASNATRTGTSTRGQ